jgi:hypothetical protein
VRQHGALPFSLAAARSPSDLSSLIASTGVSAATMARGARSSDTGRDQIWKKAW